MIALRGQNRRALSADGSGSQQNTKNPESTEQENRATHGDNYPSDRIRGVT